MRITEIKSCYVGPEISPEQFISEHFFLYLIKGEINGYDGRNHFTLRAGECCIVRKNHLVRYNKVKINDEFEKVVIILDKLFLKTFQEKYKAQVSKIISGEAFLILGKKKLIPEYLQSLMPYYDNEGKINPAFADIKREELLLILMKISPELTNILFDFGIPEKIDIEEFMNRNYKFNVSIKRFAYLTGRSLSSFKRDFKNTFGETPGRWLMKKRLQEAHFLIEKQNKKPGSIYLDLGFEDLSHFSFTFRKMFGYSPRQILKKNEPAVSR